MKKQTILMLGYSNWDHWRPTHDLAQIFSRENTVIFVERLLSYTDLRWKKVGHLNCLNRLRFKPMRRISKNLFVIQPPPGLPSLIPFVSRFMHKELAYFSNHFGKILQAQWLKIYLRRQGIKPTVLFLNHTLDLHLAGYFGERISCWYVYDELALISAGTDYSNLLDRIERENINKISIVFASSRAQYAKRKKTHSAVFFMPNGCDSGSNTSSEPPEMRTIGHPRIGYVGTIDFRIDFYLLEQAAADNPNLSFIFIGWVSPEVEDIMRGLTAYPNVFFLGARPKAKMREYIKGLDVGLIPFKVNEVTNTMLPIKTFEYLAGGLPVVAVPLAELAPYFEILHTADDTGKFSELLNKAVKDNSEEKIAKRIAIARENTWEARAVQMNKLISAELSLKG